MSLHFTHFPHIETLSFAQVRSNLLPVLSKKEKFNFTTTKQQVIDFLNHFLSFSEPEKEFIKHFNQREYRPEILFAETTILENIEKHPMALWKCRPAE